MNFRSLYQFLELLEKENKFEISCTMLGQLLAHGLRFGLAQRPRQRGRPNRRGALAHVVTAHSAVTVARLTELADEQGVAGEAA
jgi:hypothetical protein